MTDGVVWDLWSLALMELLFHYWNTFASSLQFVYFHWSSGYHWWCWGLTSPVSTELPDRKVSIVKNLKSSFSHFWFSLLLWTLSTYPTFTILDSNTVTMIVDVLMIIGFILMFVPNIFLTYIIIRVWWFLPNASYKTQTDWIEPTGRFKSSLHWVKYWEDKFPDKWESVSRTIYHFRHQYQ